MAREYNEHAQHEQGLVDILEIYHARGVQAQIVAQLRRLTAVDPELPLAHISRRREALQYYEAMLFTVDELLHRMGDHQAHG